MTTTQTPEFAFSVALRFAATNSSTKHEDIVAFAHAVPWLCARAVPELHIEIIAVDLIAATDIAVALRVRPRAQDPEVIETSGKMGIKDPIATQATLDLMMWIIALRRIGDSPLQVAWAQWRSSRGSADLPETVPIMLMEYNFGQSSSTAKLTSDPALVMARYDGPTETATRVDGDPTGPSR
jgi:hypothetical protein